MLVDDLERLAETRTGGSIDPLDGVAGGRDGVDQVLALRGQEVVPLLQFVELIDGHHVDRPEALDLGAQADRR